MSTKQGRDQLKTYFETGDRPTEEEFAGFIDSDINQVDDELYAVKQGGSGPTFIGVGTDNPTSRLEVNGDINVTGHVFGKKTGTSDDFLNLSNSAEIQLFGSNYTNRKGDINLIGDKRNSASGKISFDQRLTDTQWRNNMLIDTNGNVGIGTAAPTNKLEVNVTSGSNTGLKLTRDAGLNKVLVSDASGNASWKLPATITDGLWKANGTNIVNGNTGNVGIGTNAPGNKLEIVVATGSNTGLKLTRGAASDRILVSDATGNARWEDPTNLTNDFWRKNGNHILNTNSGNVGIGTNSPQAKLDVQGDISINNNTLLLRDGDDLFHGLKFVTATDGPHLFGNKGGALTVKNPDINNNPVETKVMEWFALEQRVDFKGKVTVNGNPPFLIERLKFWELSGIVSLGKTDSEYGAAVVVGFSTTETKLDELWAGLSDFRMAAYTYLLNGVWHVRADVKSVDNANADHEHWVITIMYIRKEFVEWNTENAEIQEYN